MKNFNNARIPLQEEQFIDAATARFYDEHSRRFMGSVYRSFVKKLSKVNPTGNKVLDVGTGSGHLAIELAKAYPDWQITGIDVSEEMIKLAWENASRSSLNDKINFMVYSAEALPFANGDFDLVVSNASLHLWGNPLKVFKEIARVTAPGGYCLLWDNLRLTASLPFLSIIGWGMGMNKAQRELWLKAVQASYTISEVKEILRESPLKDARIVFIPGLLFLGVEWRKGTDKY
jgi:ubiquinone/menaquinone biosynthesis C-methylase UbiE